MTTLRGAEWVTRESETIRIYLEAFFKDVFKISMKGCILEIQERSLKDDNRLLDSYE